MNKMLPRNKSPYAWLGGLLIVIWGGILIQQLPHSTILVPDSASYLSFFSSRTAGYPLFLSLFKVEAVKYVQTGFWVFSVAIFFYTSLQFFKTHPCLALLGLVLLAANQSFNSYHATIMTESLYASLLLLLVSTYIKHIGNTNSKWLLLLGILSGLCIAVRPSAWFLLPLNIIGISLLQHQKSSRKHFAALAIVTAALLGTVALERIYTYQHHQGNTTSLFGIHLFAKAALVSSPLTRPSRTFAQHSEKRTFSDYSNILENRYREIRGLINNTPNFTNLNHILSSYEICIQYSCSKEIDIENPAARDAAWRRLTENIPAYLKLVYFNFRSLWTVYNHASLQDAAMINQWLKVNKPLPMQEHVEWLGKQVSARGVPHQIIRLMVWGAGIVSAIWLFVGIYYLLRHQTCPLWQSLAIYASFALHGSFLLTSMTGVAVTRYTITLWPFMILVALSMLSVLFRAAPRLRKSPLENL